MKVVITVEIDDKDGKFFADLISDKFAWATEAHLCITGVGNDDETADATWLLRANVAMGAA